MPVAQPKQRKHEKIRHIEYYDLQTVFDNLYADSKENKIFNKLLPLVTSKENIMLAYRNIKRNNGSNTHGVDKMTIRDLENISEDKFIDIVKKKFEYYKPKAVRRVEIPKPNGKQDLLAYQPCGIELYNSVYCKSSNQSVKRNFMKEAMDLDPIARHNTPLHKATL